MHVCKHTCHNIYAEIRQHLAGVRIISSVLLACGSQRLNRSGQVWQAPVATEPPWWLAVILYYAAQLY